MLSLYIHISGVGAVNKVHYPAEILLGRFNDQMIVIRHQYLCMQNKAKFDLR
jgi:hypothetical protein